MRSLNNLLLVFVASAALTGCAINPPKVIKLLPPVDLMQDCGKSDVFIAKNKDLAKAYQLRDADLDRCNLDKRALRSWANEGIDEGTQDADQTTP